jgi:hypothetical protein
LPLVGIVVAHGCLVDGSVNAEIVPELAPRDGDLVVTHRRPGGFTASQLDLLLRTRGIDTVLFTGVATNASVEGTARQASDLGYRTVVVADGCLAANPTAHDANIAPMGLLAEIATSADVIAGLTAGPAWRPPGCSRTRSACPPRSPPLWPARPRPTGSRPRPGPHGRHRDGRGREHAARGHRRPRRPGRTVR